MKNPTRSNPTRSTPQILSVRPDLVGYLLQDVWADLAQNFWRHAKYMAKGFLKKNTRKKRFLKFVRVFLRFRDFF
jgi:hypothetical protein